MAGHLDVSLITIQELLENGREELKRKLAESHSPGTGGHLIWHLFVSTGTACHFCAVLWYAG